MKGKRVLIIGSGLSGQAVFFKVKNNGGVPVYYEDQIIRRNDWDLCVMSPSISKRSDIYAKLISEGIPVYSEIDFAFLCTPRKIIAVTGTNGKTTTVRLIEGMLKSADVDCVAAGNIGVPLSTSRNAELTVCEVSSFMLEQSFFFRSVISVVLNIAPDHLDRHKTFGEYERAKIKLWSLGETAVSSDSLLHLVPKNKTTFSYSLCGDADLTIDEDRIVYGKDKRLLAKTDEIALKGKHNIENVLAALSCCILYMGPDKRFVDFLRNYKGERYRLEYKGIIRGKKVYNDSKGTNTAATFAALKEMKGKTISLIGGYDKKEDYEDFFNNAGKNVCFCIYGAIGRRVYEVGRRAGAECYLFTEMEDAVKFAMDIKADNLLFSPTTSSYDRFKNYEERGEYFDKLVNTFKI